MWRAGTGDVRERERERKVRKENFEGEAGKGFIQSRCCRIFVQKENILIRNRKDCMRKKFSLQEKRVTFLRLLVLVLRS